ncbi:hypothetical protein ACFSX9_15445 [Flavobacterium ardleyense]|uniref:Uncharacterized protein n=1 Tax=Flavobacterium ardleyense TaxID=2038737 RepID=A0ABW5ZB39_9FLAO
MSTNLISMLILLIPLGILGNYGVHLYFKNKRKLLFKSIGEKLFVEIKNIDVEMYATNKLGVSSKFFNSDIILFENTLLLLLRNKIINTNSSIMQLSKSDDFDKLEGVGNRFTIGKKEYLTNKIKLISTRYSSPTIVFEVNLEFKAQLEELQVVKEFLESVEI